MYSSTYLSTSVLKYLVSLHVSIVDCLERKSQDHPNYSILYDVQQSGTVYHLAPNLYAQTHEQLLQLSVRLGLRFQVKFVPGKVGIFMMCCRVAEKESLNKMSVVNLASIFGPILMKLDNVCSDD